jgi:hypothetical protein
MHHVRVPSFTTASAFDLTSPQSVAHIAAGASDMAGNAARVAVERSGRLARNKTETSNIKSATGRIRCGEHLTSNIAASAAFNSSFLILTSSFLLFLLFSAFHTETRTRRTRSANVSRRLWMNLIFPSPREESLE